ncbi:multicopper oxidase domain-containing protein [Pseudonocardia endophytica]|uniref:FtsP/CotA-like multicopper oxidase with cupredoxin domain n=1 Tax=Pseudonocardia endophytica TaxID=401976 RepID=A0A4R1HVQ8_PSEEN|nr:multicopper oxidase domain-containing protein [Pseudonocardia endophytica]TCK21582.1 FtsP/CotA-like multicopper oxidase with cupredoxin domain [Pseudonocardia endophytica]
MTEPRTYDVVALTVPIAYNAHGDRTTDGSVFALAEHAVALRAVTGDRPDPLVRPLVLRARVGERVVVQFRNDTGHRAGIHPQGVRYDVERADGGVVGCNPDSAAEPGGRRRYVWDCPNEGVFFFGDLADLRGCENGSQAHGLFGALVVEPEGATWTDPETGAPLPDGLSADVHVPGGTAFREFVTFLQDAAANDDGPPVALSGYRCEPVSRRPADDRRYSSWTHGDPATPVLRAYAGDRTLIRLVHAGLRDSRVFHLHGHRWRTSAGAPAVDAVGLGPQEALTIEPVGGAGSVHGAAGDAMWEFPGTDVWGVLRVFDVALDGNGHHPDGTPIPALRPLPGHRPPPEPTPERPGFPTFVAGVHPGPPPRPPRTPSTPSDGDREPSELERAAFCADPRPGEAFTRVGPVDVPVRRYHLLALQGVLHHHRGERADHRDDSGVLYVPADDVARAGGVDAFRAQLASGERDVHPVAIRAAAGEVVELALTNALPEGPDVGAHVHLLGHDPLVADGAAVGWNYASGVAAGRTRTVRWYCDGELGTAVFTDALPERRLFGSLVVEPAGARWTDPHDPDREVTSAEAAVVTLPDGSSFREQVLAVADGVPLRRHPHGAAPEPHAPGRATVGYRCEPLDERPGDPADRFSSREHGDPGTPLPRAYPGERVRIRLYQGAGTGRHGVVAHGLRWPSRPGDPSSPPCSQWTLGPGQAADLHVDDLGGPGDHLWSLSAGEDAWPGAWGLLRVHDRPMSDLPTLPGAFPVPPDPQRGPVRRYRVTVRAAARDHGRGRSDPLALVYTVDSADGADGADGPGALVLRAHAGEWVEVTLTNELSGPPSAASADPLLSGEQDPGERVVSDRVSLHAVGLRHDVRGSDGTAAGTNPDSTVKPGHSVTYRWFADAPGPVLLSDRADVRTHRHRGLVGVLVVEPPDVTPVHPSGHGSGWVGEQALLRRTDGTTERELVLLLSDGLRLHRAGGPDRPLPETAVSGSAAFNHRSAALVPDRPSLADPNPPTPVLACAPGDRLRVHVVAATDRAGAHSFTVHGHDWPCDEHPDAPRVGTTGGLAAGAVRSIAFTAGGPGDYAYRSGALRWALAEGLWGVIRVRRL